MGGASNKPPHLGIPSHVTIMDVRIITLQLLRQSIKRRSQLTHHQGASFSEAPFSFLSFFLSWHSQLFLTSLCCIGRGKLRGHVAAQNTQFAGLLAQFTENSLHLMRFPASPASPDRNSIPTDGQRAAGSRFLPG